MLKKLDEEPEQLIIPGCSKLCPLTKVRSLLQNVIPGNFNTECAAKGEGVTVPPPKGP